MSGYLRPLLSITLIVLSILGLMNVYSDNTDVVRMAAHLACPACDSNSGQGAKTGQSKTGQTSGGEARLVQSGRSPIAQTLTFQTGPAALVTVECRRALVFVGDYECQLVTSP